MAIPRIAYDALGQKGNQRYFVPSLFRSLLCTRPLAIYVDLSYTVKICETRQDVLRSSKK